MGSSQILLMAWIVVILVFFSIISKNIKTRKENITYVKANDFYALKNKHQLIDVRSKEKFNESHILGARNVTISQIKNGADKKFFPNKPIYIYCNSGHTAKKAANILVKNNFANIVVMNDKFTNYPTKNITKK
ncbi:MAG: rhodanese-like domain-containing protein [Bacilli bacterium]